MFPCKHTEIQSSIITHSPSLTKRDLGARRVRIASLILKSRVKIARVGWKIKSISLVTSGVGCKPCTNICQKSKVKEESHRMRKENQNGFAKSEKRFCLEDQLEELAPFFHPTLRDCRDDVLTYLIEVWGENSALDYNGKEVRSFPCPSFATRLARTERWNAASRTRIQLLRRDN